LTIWQTNFYYAYNAMNTRRSTQTLCETFFSYDKRPVMIIDTGVYFISIVKN